MAQTVKSTNEVASITLGLHSQWLHIGAGNTGRITISPRTNRVVVLIKVIINASGAGQPATLTDSGAGIIAEIGAGAAPTHLPYNLPLTGNLLVDNTGALDLTLIFKDR